MQRELGHLLQIERATLSGIVAALVRKGLVDQTPDAADQRQRLVEMTATGARLWKELPAPVDLIQAIAFNGTDDEDLATVIPVLQAATQRLNRHMSSQWTVEPGLAPATGRVGQSADPAQR